MQLALTVLLGLGLSIAALLPTGAPTTGDDCISASAKASEPSKVWTCRRSAAHAPDRDRVQPSRADIAPPHRSSPPR